MTERLWARWMLICASKGPRSPPCRSPAAAGPVPAPRHWSKSLAALLSRGVGQGVSWPGRGGLLSHVWSGHVLRLLVGPEGRVGLLLAAVVAAVSIRHGRRPA